jgi:hypothetical protein
VALISFSAVAWAERAFGVARGTGDLEEERFVGLGETLRLRGLEDMVRAMGMEAGGGGKE